MSSLRAPVGATENHTLDKNKKKSTFAGIFFHPHLPMLRGRFNTTVLCPLWKYGIEAPLFLTKAPDKTLGGRDRGANKSGQGSTWSASSISLLSKAKWFGINCLNPFTLLGNGDHVMVEVPPIPILPLITWNRQLVSSLRLDKPARLIIRLLFGFDSDSVLENGQQWINMDKSGWKWMKIYEG